MDNFEEGQSKYGRIFKVAGPRKYPSFSRLTVSNFQSSLERTCQDLRCTNSLRSAGTSWSERSSSSKETPPPSSATKTPVSKTVLLPYTFRLAGLTYGDPIQRTGNPLSVELGPGTYLYFSSRKIKLINMG